jgi:hypothetical protein
MVRYRRNFVPGGTYFFTVTLADRTSSALVDHVDALRMAFRIARQERPFTIEAWPAAGFTDTELRWTKEREVGHGTETVRPGFQA